MGRGEGLGEMGEGLALPPPRAQAPTSSTFWGERGTGSEVDTDGTQLTSPTRQRVPKAAAQGQAGGRACPPTVRGTGPPGTEHRGLGDGGKGHWEAGARRLGWRLKREGGRDGKVQGGGWGQRERGQEELRGGKAEEEEGGGKERKRGRRGREKISEKRKKRGKKGGRRKEGEMRKESGRKREKTERGRSRAEWRRLGSGTGRCEWQCDPQHTPSLHWISPVLRPAPPLHPALGTSPCQQPPLCSPGALQAPGWPGPAGAGPPARGGHQHLWG